MPKLHLERLGKYRDRILGLVILLLFALVLGETLLLYQQRAAMRAIVKTIVALGRSLEIAVTAEGVETQEQAAMLREFGCPQVQGFLYGYPEAADAGARTKGKVTPIRAARSSAA